MAARWIVAAVVDLVVFATTGVALALNLHAPEALRIVYQVSCYLGLILAVFGFIRLTRGGEAALRRASLVVVLVFIPGCAALITILTAFGKAV